MLNQIDLNKKLEIRDNLFTQEESSNLFDSLIKYPYKYGEKDSEKFEPTGLVHEFEDSDQIFQEILKKTKLYFSELDELNLYRKYINFFMPGEFPNFHEDGQGLTLLYYITKFYNPYEGGETQFVNLDQTITGIFPKPGRAVLFDGMITHRATSYKLSPRLTIAMKYRR